MNRLARAGTAMMIAALPLVALSAAAPESILPPGFDDPAPAPSPTPRPAPRPTATRAPSTATPAPTTTSSPVVQAVPDNSGSSSTRSSSPATPAPTTSAPSRTDTVRRLLERLPSPGELDDMDTDEIDELLGLKPSFDIPPAARRSTEVVGLLGPEEGGMTGSLGNTRGAYVGNIIKGTQGPLVSRWGHILLRRALASRLRTPGGMDGVEFAAIRAALLNRMGEATAARALVQEVDTDAYSPALIASAYDAYVSLGDFTGACPMVRLHARERDDGEWDLLRGICSTYSGESSGRDRIDRARRQGTVPRIDALLAQKYAGAVGARRQAVTIEWDEVEDMTAFRYALATSTGSEVPDNLRSAGGPALLRQSAVNPAETLGNRAASSGAAAAYGILSASALVDLYAQVQAADMDGPAAVDAAQLREAYLDDANGRMDAIRGIWGDGDNYGRSVLTAYAAARIPPNEAFEDDAGRLIASMLAAGLDRNAMRWSSVVADGSLGWGLLSVANPAQVSFSEGDVRDFLNKDESAGSRKSAFLVAGLAGLGRIDPRVGEELAGDLGTSLNRESRWTRAISRAGRRGNQPLTVFLAALGMQGSDWSKMTPLHLYHVVSALSAAGLDAEARMIAAEAVARG